MGGNSDKHENNDNHNNNNNQVQQQPQQNYQPMQQQTQAQEMNPNDVCFDYNRKFAECMKYNNNSSTICQSMYEDLKSCQNKMV